MTRGEYNVLHSFALRVLNRVCASSGLRRVLQACVLLIVAASSYCRNDVSLMIENQCGFVQDLRLESKVAEQVHICWDNCKGIALRSSLSSSVVLDRVRGVLSVIIS